MSESFDSRYKLDESEGQANEESIADSEIAGQQDKIAAKQEKQMNQYNLFDYQAGVEEGEIIEESFEE